MTTLVLNANDGHAVNLQKLLDELAVIKARVKSNDTFISYIHTHGGFELVRRETEVTTQKGFNGLWMPITTQTTGNEGF